MVASTSVKAVIYIDKRHIFTVNINELHSFLRLVT